MGIYKPIKLTVDGYKITMSDSIDLYVGDRVTLQFELYKLAVATRFGTTARTTDIQPLTAILYIETPDGRDVMEAADIIDNLVEFNLSEEYTQNIGVSRLQLRLFDDNGDRITLPEFTFNVNASIYGDQVTKINLCLADENRNAVVDEKGNRIATPTQALNVAVNKQIQSFKEKRVYDGGEDILIQDSGITKRIKVDSLLAQTNAQLSRAIINIADYENLTSIVNGVTTWNGAFDKAFSDLKNGGTLIIPDGDYYIDGRVIIEEKKGIEINCSGKILPVNGKQPFIGTFSIKKCRDVVVNGLHLDGNKNNVPETNSFGTQTLIEVTNVDNIIFNNLVIENTQECGFNSNGNLTNVIFNNTQVKNIGEHGFYFGGDCCENISFNNIKVIDIGMNAPSQSRAIGVIKFRNKELSDKFHDNIIIDGFEFISNSSTNSTNKNFVQCFETKNITLRNGKIMGIDTSIFATNTSIDNLLIDNVNIDGKLILHGLNKISAHDTPQTINNPGKMNIQIINSHLKCACNNFSDIALYQNCNIQIQYNNFLDTMTTFVNKKTVVTGCVIDLKSYRIDPKSENIEFNNVQFLVDTGVTQPLINFLSPENSLIKFNNVELVNDTSLFFQSENGVKASFINSTIRGNIKSLKKLKLLEIVNCYLKETRLNLYSSFEKILVNGVYDVATLKRKDFGIFTATCKSTNTFVNLSLKYDRISDVETKNLLITNNRGIKFEYSISDNVIQLSTITTQSEDTIFTVIYSGI